ncbi:MBL fold metallo-hydrolase [Streptomyces montanisoli]|uniref:MBL fold metallo-hydrolase n=1 Tax=Streptomyces montanisoli TaxID=2798581 RepID=A0A940MJB1_9ACTN|nr:MBL fold metallo-hydrolase [Streptomyces montanisoli]MBP0462244.1 MBL fold metallo-hydrolase [Streptomyces montanisoli]
MTDDAPDSVHVRFIGNATLLIRYGPLTLLTDPNFLHKGSHAYLGHGLTSRRLTEPALGIGELPDLDAVLLSHMHGDHWDRVARRGLDRSLPVITTPHAARRLRRLHGFREACALRDWQNHTLTHGGSAVHITALPARHARGGLLNAVLPPVMGSMLEFGPAGGPTRLRLYVSGDTMPFDGLAEIGRRFPTADLAVLHLGGTQLPGGLIVTMTGRQGAELAARLRPRLVLPVHYGDYTVMKSPLSDFLGETERLGLADRVVPCGHGQGMTLTAGEARAVVD